MVNINRKTYEKAVWKQYYNMMEYFGSMKNRETKD